jgi:hypothetical protein
MPKALSYHDGDPGMEELRAEVERKKRLPFVVGAGEDLDCELLELVLPDASSTGKSVRYNHGLGRVPVGGFAVAQLRGPIANLNVWVLPDASSERTVEVRYIRASGTAVDVRVRILIF